MPATLKIDPERLRRMRLEQALSQRELAKIAGVRAATVSDIENGSSARLSTIKALATALAVEPLELAQITEVHA